MHSSIHPSMHARIHFIHPSIHSSVHAFIYSFIHPSTHSFVHLSILHPSSIHLSFIHPFIHRSIHPSIHSFIYPFIHHPSIHLSPAFYSYVSIHPSMCTPTALHSNARNQIQKFVLPTVQLFFLSFRWSFLSNCWHVRYA